MPTFLQLVKGLTPSSLVDTLCDGLERQWVNIDMGSYGHSEGMLCFGCAATNALCQLAQKSMPSDKIDNVIARGKFFGISERQSDKNKLATLGAFERGINNLRVGLVYDMNGVYERRIHLHHLTIPMDVFDKFEPKTPDHPQDRNILPAMTTDTWRECIPRYRELAEFLRKEGL